MTCVGFNIVAANRAIAWADSETYTGPSNEPSGHTVKLSINPLACVIGIGTGRVGLLSDAHAEVMRCLTFDQIIEKMPAALGDSAWHYAHLPAAEKAPLGIVLYGIVGFSHRRHRICGAMFDSRKSFVVREVISFQSPALGCPATDEKSALQVAREQFSVVPKASAGVITFAEVTQVSVNTRLIFDLGRKSSLRKVANLCRLRTSRMPVNSITYPAGFDYSAEARRRVVEQLAYAP